MTFFQRIKTPLAEREPKLGAPVSTGLLSAGDVLRQRREAVGLDLGQIAAVLKIKPAYLAAIEEGRLDRLPGPTYAVGFVRAYSEHLGLYSEEILRRFKLEAAGLDVKPDLSFPMPLDERSVPGGGMLLVALILAICGYGTWYYLSTAERSRPERVTEVPETLLPSKPDPAIVAPAKAPAISGASVAAAAVANQPSSGAGNETKTGGPVPTGAPAASVATAPPRSASAVPVAPNTHVPAAPVPVLAAASPASSAAPTPTSPASPGSQATPTEASASPPPPQADAPRAYGEADNPSHIILRATADSWIQIRDSDHSVLFTGLLKAGDSYQVPDQPGLSMRAGNAGGLAVVIDGKPAPPLGPPGAVRNVALDPQSLIAEHPARD
jgi:cytoskeleton protein RodZ